MILWAVFVTYSYDRFYVTNQFYVALRWAYNVNALSNESSYDSIDQTSLLYLFQQLLLICRNWCCLIAHKCWFGVRLIATNIVWYLQKNIIRVVRNLLKVQCSCNECQLRWFDKVKQIIYNLNCCAYNLLNRIYDKARCVVKWLYSFSMKTIFWILC